MHEAFREILRFWFDRGVAGFRIDVAHGLYKDAELRGNPPETSGNPLAGRFGQQQAYNANRPETHQVYRDWRRIADSYPATRVLLGETWVGDPERLATFYGNDDQLQLAFNFPFVFARLAAPELPAAVAGTMAALPTAACPVWTASNHDVGRFPTRWCDGDQRKVRLALLVLATLPGAMVLYYGDEIGMTDVDVPLALQQDKMSRGRAGGTVAAAAPATASAPAHCDTTPDSTGWHGNRDRARTPMQWDDSANAGFTTATAPWLPAGDGAAISVAGQREDPGSVLGLCRELIGIRRAETGRQRAGYQALPAPPGCWAYLAGGLTVLANFSDHPVTCQDPGGPVLLSTTGAAQPPAGDITLAPWQGIITRTAGARQRHDAR